MKCESVCFYYKQSERRKDNQQLFSFYRNMIHRFPVHLLFVWMCFTIVLSNNTQEVQDTITNNPEEDETQPNKVSSVNNGGQQVSVDHINKV